MKRKNGFTLVELVAVIAVLGVILLIVVPNVIELLDSGKKDTFARQIQSVYLEAEKEFSYNYAKNNNQYFFCSKDLQLLGCSAMSLNKTDTSYVVSLSNKGEVSYIALGNDKYCYVDTKPESADIDKSKIIKGKLSCNISGCSCGNTSSELPNNDESNYKYWDARNCTTVDYYENDEYPSSAVNSLDALGPKTHVFIRTSLDDQGSVIKHEPCFKYKTKYYCVSKDLWQDELYNSYSEAGYDTKEVLESEMNNTFNQSPSCDYASRFTWCEYYYDATYFNAFINYNGYLKTNAYGYFCSVDEDGYAMCAKEGEANEL